MGDILAVGGVPVQPVVCGSGHAVRPTYYAAGERIELRTAAYLTGWAAAMRFWVSAFAALRVTARNSPGLVAFGMGVLFVGTHRPLPRALRHGAGVADGLSRIRVGTRHIATAGSWRCSPPQFRSFSRPPSQQR